MSILKFEIKFWAAWYTKFECFLWLKREPPKTPSEVRNQRIRTCWSFWIKNKNDRPSKFRVIIQLLRPPKIFLRSKNSEIQKSRFFLWDFLWDFQIFPLKFPLRFPLNFLRISLVLRTWIKPCRPEKPTLHKRFSRFRIVQEKFSNVFSSFPHS